MKRLLVALLVLLCLPSSIVSAKDVYNYDDLLIKYQQQSKIIENIELDQLMKEKQYKDMLKGYDELDENVEDILNQLEVYQLHMDQTLEKAELAEPNEKISLYGMKMDAKEYYLTVEFPMYMNAYTMFLSTYNGLIKGILPSYVSMEQLKFDMEHMEDSKVQVLLQSENEFKELCLQYVLATKEKNYNATYRSFLEEEVVKIKQDIELGKERQIELQKKENELLLLSLKENSNEQEINSTYQQIKTMTDISLTEEIGLDLKIEEVKAVQPIESILYGKVVRQESISYNTLLNQVQLLDDMAFMVEKVYDEEDIDGQVLLKDLEKNRIIAKQNTDQTDYLIDKINDDYGIAYETYLLALEQIHLAEEEKIFADQNIELGKISKLEYSEAKLNYQQSELDYYQAIVDYVTAYHTYEEALSGILN